MRVTDKQARSISELEPLDRNNYYYGKLMTAQDFFLEQNYFNEKRWLLNRMISGWGIVCGLDVTSKEGLTNKVIISPGLAIDCYGREILITKEQEVILKPEVNQCEGELSDTVEELDALLICLEFYACLMEPVPVVVSSGCKPNKSCEFNRIRDHYKIRVRKKKDIEVSSSGPHFCPFNEEERRNLHKFLCDKLKAGCPECSEQPCLILAEVTLDSNNPEVYKIDTCSRRKLVYNNPLLFDLINCFARSSHYNYIGTWLVLGPVFDQKHQIERHYQTDNHPKAEEIIKAIDNSKSLLNPESITDTKKIKDTPKHGDKVKYKLIKDDQDIIGEREYTWKIRNFSGMDWMNIHDVEDNIHNHLSSNYSDPFDSGNPENFWDKHHALAFFLVYIMSLDPEEKRTTKLWIRSDDSVRVWFNGEELLELKYEKDRNIKDYVEQSAEIALQPTNILLIAVSETHIEWGVSARIEDDENLRFSVQKP
jgi:hypothetical protein